MAPPEEAAAAPLEAPDAAGVGRGGGSVPWRRFVPAGSVWFRPVLAGLGAFLVVVGLMLRFYAAPRLIVAPADFYATITLADPHASYFDQSALLTRRNVTLTYSNTIRGDAAAATGTLAVWDQYTVLADNVRHIQLNSVFQRSVFNRRTGALFNCCGASVNDDTRVRQDGIGVVFWPIGTRKITYQVYDTNTERAWAAFYNGTATVQGITAYRFTQHIPVTVVQQMPGIPTVLLGVPGPSRTVVADRTFQADNTFWVDPRTGVPIDVQERIVSVLVGPGGKGHLTVASADLKMTLGSQRLLAGVATKNASSIRMVQLIGPGAGVALGLLLILAATIPGRVRSALARQRRQR